MPKLEIDGISVDADPGTSIIEVADRLGIAIPRFCYHHKLSVAANCRMCLVQVEKAPKALPACATPIAEGMKVWTKSKETIAAQRAVMEFLLINHPLDCPVCDQGGECELQDVSLQYGRSDSRFTEAKRAVLDHSLGPLIATEMTRCIHCTRCVRFGDEIAGEREMGATGRGEFMEIGTFVAQTVDSEVSGNIIDLCPVGALTSKPYRFKARAWELKESAGIAPHDCIGANIFIHSMNNRVLRVVPKDTEELNEVWLADRDRFSYEGLLHADRIRKPLVHKQRWITQSWIEAFKYALTGIQECLKTYNPAQLGVLVTPNASCEELYLLQKFTRALGCNNIDHRLRQLDFSQQELASKYPNLGIEFRELSQQDVVLLIGSNIAKEQPLASLRLRKMVRNGGNVCAINSVDYKYNFVLAQKSIVPAGNLLTSIAGVAKELIRLTNFSGTKDITTALTDVKARPEEQKIANLLLTGKKKQIILGQIALMHPQATQIIALGNLIAQLVGGNCGNFSEGANAAGAWLTGCVPHREPNGQVAKTTGSNAMEMLQSPLKCYILYGVEPEFDSILGSAALETLKQADFVIAISAYQSDALLDIADVILPLAQFSEYAGTMVNINGTMQTFDAAVEPFGESRPGWKIMRMFGSLAELPGFEYNTLDEVTAEMLAAITIEHALPKWQIPEITPIKTTIGKELLRIAPVSLYAVDGLVRRAKSLQATTDAYVTATIGMNSNTAQNLNVSADEIVVVSAAGNADAPIKLPVVIDDRIADFTVIILQAHAQTLQLGLPYRKLEVRKC